VTGCLFPLYLGLSDQGLQVIALETPINNRRLVWSTMSGISVDRGIERNLFWRYNDFVKPDVAKVGAETCAALFSAAPLLRQALPHLTQRCRVLLEGGSQPLP
jgi:hypothetical protein